MNNICWYIDDKPAEMATFSRILREIFQDSLEIREICPPFVHKSDYFHLLEDPNIGCFFIDQKLQDNATYSGIELASDLRVNDTKIPIYILTNYSKYPEEFTGSEWSVEDIIAKDKIRDDSEMYKARIIRRLNNYSDILQEREKRFQYLLRKSLNNSISSEEYKELDQLQVIRVSPILSKEIESLNQVDQLLKTYNEQLDKIKRAEK